MSKKKPSLGDLLILAGQSMNDPEAAKRDAKRAAKKQAKQFFRELLENAFDEDEDDEEPRGK
jgi:hypothetical protein